MTDRIAWLSLMGLIGFGSVWALLAALLLARLGRPCLQGATWAPAF
jgi:hypothetical protein